MIKASRLSLMCAIPACVLASPAMAQDAETDTPEQSTSGLNTIVVTAQKREQNLQSVGIAVTAVTAESIESQNITSSADLAGRIVGLENYSPYGPGTSANVVIRGIGVNDFGEGHEAPVTTYVDEFYYVAVPAVDFALFDLDRVEVLRGPQGTLFGRNSTGGLIHYVTAKPSAYAEGFANATYSSFNTLKLEAAANAPISDTVSVRLSGFSMTSDGYQKQINPDLERGGQAGSQAARLQIRYQGDDGWDLNLKGEYGRIDTVHSYYETITGYVDNDTGLVMQDDSITDIVGYAERNGPAAAKNTAWANRPALLKATIKSALFRAEKEFGDTTFTSVTGYQDYERRMEEDSDGTPNDIVYASFPYQLKEVTQELRLFHDGDTTDWTAGVYGLHSVANNQPSAVFNFPIDPPTADGIYDGEFFPFALNADWRMRTNSLSVFGQLEQDLSDTLKLIAGARLTYDDKTFADADNAAFRTCESGQPGSCYLISEGGDGTANPFDLEYDQLLVSGKLALEYSPNADTLFYASVSRGTKGGGFNNGFYPDNTSLSQIPYKDETLYAFEIGEKATLLDNRLRINTSIFYYDYSDYQVFNYFGLVGLISNQDARAYGVETEIEAELADGLTAYGSAAYLNTKIYDVSKATPSGDIVTADRSMAFAPKWSGSGGLTYKTMAGSLGELVLDWNFNARSSRYAGNFNDPGTKLDSYFKHNASVALDFDEGVNVRAFVDNIGNVKNYTYLGPSFASIGIIQARYAMPRTYGVAVGIEW
ncbi:TonB-dependent receptor [Croceicoccus sediminis]|uniref:TonB-dependent receptor n=1 Tax=Croceicoccus sediminis TaxID=2571150 RepID=UPI001183A459|nr:TonB-dependent receptor [Croceicoccus sediminis]